MTNEENDRYLAQMQISEIRRWRYHKCNELLDIINLMLLTELQRRISG